MIHRTATTITLFVALMLGLASSLVQAEGAAGAAPAPTACEKKADKKKITDTKKRAAFIKKCENKAKKAN